MKLGAYQFAVTSNTDNNFSIIKSAVLKAAKQDIKLLVFPECALTGYPPHDIESSAKADFDKLPKFYEQLQQLSHKYSMIIIVGTILQENNKFYNSALIFSPDKEMKVYHKRALWGWDKDNFHPGDRAGLFEACGKKIGIRICYEIRFPEFFRELYNEKTDLNIILFYDVSDFDNAERYDLIKSHIRTRAVENVCHTLTVNTIKPYQTAPTALYDRSGHALAELTRNTEGLLSYDLNDGELNFGEQGIKSISDSLL